MSEITECCICLEDKQIDYSCECCKEGKICSECMDKKRGINDDEQYVKCPICRTHNWKHLYTAIIYDLEYTCYGYTSQKYQIAWDIYNKNSDI
jgi:hypothetical protein